MTLDRTVEQKRGSAPRAAVADPDEHPSAGGSAGSAASSDLPATGLDRPSHATPRAAMHAEEVVRTRRFIQVAIALMAIAGGALVVVGGDPFVKRLLAGAMAVNTATLLVFLRYIRDPARYTPERALLPAAIAILTVALACYFFGAFSPASVTFMLGVYFFSLSSSALASLVAYLSCAALSAGIAVFVATGVLPDLGIVRAEGVPAVDKIMMALLVQAVYALTFLYARLSRRATVSAVEGLETALRQVSQREALLQEANRDLERALKGGYRGRWTGERVGAWRLKDVIGRGAMGEVYEATHESAATPAAVKLLSAEAQGDGGKVRRFLREAEVLSKLSSPHIVRVHDVGHGGDGPLYIAMELLEGHDLARHLRKKRRLPPRRVVDLCTQVADALEVARGADIVHRDLKPQNLFLAEPDGGPKVWKVLDFGISKLGGGGTLTQGHVLGTPGYMAPEQATGGEVDHRADVFALAAIAYRTLTGRPPFVGDDFTAIMFDAAFRQPTRPGELADLPADVDLVLALGLAKRPEDRFPTAAAFARALAAAFALQPLAPELRRAAEELVGHHPWGKRVGP